ncbi:hypothetical protein [Campylobacter gastrosuis]|uniref:Uncharacterized protein n=1 Tax=Campylobacter gastrosuis TaxID=2974576 RepID=A0ABT7HSW2_9BACT|nr:hypothetical protein [Campylobacter gastrosuis]MDL0089878.1 hypothetical protein [Campylobacter gastrosuis]
MGYIAFNNPLNLVFDSEIDTDILANAAGGLNDENLAGGSNYIATRAKIEYDHIFLKGEPPNLSEVLFMLGENFAEFALLKMQIADSAPNKSIVFETFLRANALTEQARQDAFNELLKRSGWRRGTLNNSDIGRILSGSGFFDLSRINGIGGAGGIQLGRLAEERYGDSAFENALENLGMQIGGPALSALGGIIGSFFNDEPFRDSIGLNLAEATSDFMINSLANMITDKVVGSLLSSATHALGTTAGAIGTLGVANLAVSAIKEAYEVATGLDRYYGFGGDILGTINGANAYLDNRNLWQGVKSMFGLPSGLETVLSYDGETLGFAYDGKITTTINNGNFISTISGYTLKDYTNFDTFARTGYENFGDALRHKNDYLNYREREFLKNEFEKTNNKMLKELNDFAKEMAGYGLKLDQPFIEQNIAPNWGQVVWDKVWGEENTSKWKDGLGAKVWKKVWGGGDIGNVSRVSDITYNLDRSLDFSRAIEKTRILPNFDWLANDTAKRMGQLNFITTGSLSDNFSLNKYIGADNFFNSTMNDILNKDIAKMLTNGPKIIDGKDSWGDWAELDPVDKWRNMPRF